MARGSKPGERRGGREAGTPNKITTSIKEAVLETFLNLGGVSHMTSWAKETPTDFYRIAAKLIPQQISADVKHIHDVSDIPDSELANIAAGGSTGTPKAKTGQTKVH
jgi:hypothetical protein